MLPSVLQFMDSFDNNLTGNAKIIFPSSTPLTRSSKSTLRDRGTLSSHDNFIVQPFNLHSLVGPADFPLRRSHPLLLQLLLLDLAISSVVKQDTSLWGAAQADP